MPPTLQQPRAAISVNYADWGRKCGLVGAGAMVLAILIGLFQPTDFFRAYLVAALACLGPAMGCLPLIFIHRMTGGRWGRVLMPTLHAGCRMIPWTLLLCAPLLLGLRHLFPWAAPETLDEQAKVLLAKHASYFSRSAFLLRAVLYVGMSFLLIRLARPRAAAWTGPVGMILYVLTAYLIGVDWVMSIQPGWSSTGFPVIFMAGHVLCALAFCVAATILLNVPGGPDSHRPAVWNDLGNLFLGVVMFWAYVAYAQFIVVWSGNLPKEAAWYVDRNAGGWHWLLITLAILQIFLPVLLLISNTLKRRTTGFAALTGLVLFCQAAYTAWSILPTYRPRGIGFHPLDLLLALALDALWLNRFLAMAPTFTSEDTADV